MRKTAACAENRPAWLAAIASNMLERRFLLYLLGGTLAETGRVHAGARNPAPPRGTRPTRLPGTVYFATASTTWPGTGRALYDPEPRPGGSAARAWLITAGQIADIAAQEMRLAPGTFPGAAVPVVPGERVRLGPGHYETLTCTGFLDGYPVVAMTPDWQLGDVPLMDLAGPYRTVICEGLGETFGWSSWQASRYLSTLPGGGAR